ncbi:MULTISPECIES: hypothetical protein [unclassified Cellulophaga]|uniref:hypothetical protein n=1 Tax=unclassified Cellulophaga TaxID=2634405 RepID=UPI0026E22075|nr:MULTISPECIES: hypothetical protein [unclassified Cellulophaga]MDO6490981.1 hypothetical protein [Cellulophaga sp. 2_MG-2023]MDO6493825.1 hypothetical protein [Cellulophaga sp. 3_MG-2023]
MKDYFYEVEKPRILKILMFLKESLPKKCTRSNYQLTQNLLHKPFSYELNLQEKLQIIADEMREHLLIKEPIRILTLNNVEAGKFEMIDNFNCIYINANTNTQNFHQKIAILAHEMSHYYLMRKHNIKKEFVKENELLTELNAVYCGFGFLLYNGYHEEKVEIGNKIHKHKVGYISTKVIQETIIQTAYVRKQNPNHIMKNLDLGFKDTITLKFKLKKLIKEYNLAMANKKQ